MEMEFGRLRQRVFQVGKLVSHQVWDKTPVKV
jgi:hypothetical protein